jgi:hypothetical protein
MDPSPGASAALQAVNDMDRPYQSSQRRLVAAVVAMCVGGCGNGVPISTREARPLTIVGPSAHPERFAAAVRTFARDVENERAVPSDVRSYAGMQSALETLADAIVLLPRGADVLIARNPANTMRNDAVRVGAGALDNAGRTEALRHALLVAAETLDAVARGAYPDAPELPSLVSNLSRRTASIDDSKLLWTQQPSVTASLEQALDVLWTMQRKSL